MFRFLKLNKIVRDGVIAAVFGLSKSIEYMGSSNSFGSLKSILSFEMTLTPSDHER